MSTSGRFPSPATSPIRRGASASVGGSSGAPRTGHPMDRRYVSSGSGSRGYISTSERDRKRKKKVVAGLCLLLAVVLLCVIIIPPSVVLTNKKNNKSNAVNDGQGVVTTVIDGRTEVVTRDGITRSQLTTLADGQVSTVTSFVALPDVTVSRESLSEVVPEFFTTTLSGDIVVIASATRYVTGVETLTFTALGGVQSVAIVTLTDVEIVTVVGSQDGLSTSSAISTVAPPSSTSPSSVITTSRSSAASTSGTASATETRWMPCTVHDIRTTVGVYLCATDQLVVDFFPALYFLRLVFELYIFTSHHEDFCNRWRLHLDKERLQRSAQLEFSLSVPSGTPHLPRRVLAGLHVILQHNTRAHDYGTDANNQLTVGDFLPNILLELLRVLDKHFDRRNHVAVQLKVYDNDTNQYSGHQSGLDIRWHANFVGAHAINNVSSSITPVVPCRACKLNTVLSPPQSDLCLNLNCVTQWNILELPDCDVEFHLVWRRRNEFALRDRIELKYPIIDHFSNFVKCFVDCDDFYDVLSFNRHLFPFVIGISLPKQRIPFESAH
ncbi:hypothetical protein JCM16303_002361 [Sporobolomyces ruberrimus]